MEAPGLGETMRVHEGEAPARSALAKAPAPVPEAPVPEATQTIDRMLHALQGRLTLGVSPAALMVAYFDWLVHFANSPGKQAELARNLVAKWMRFAFWVARAAAAPTTPQEPLIAPLPQDGRFRSADWKRFPFNVYQQGFLLCEQWWHYATTGVRGVNHHHQDVVAFVARQLLDTFSPSNFLPTNPDVLRATWAEGGENLVRGWAHWLRDVEGALPGAPPASRAFVPGEAVALTPGKVVLRNRLIELIQYAPAPEEGLAEPVLIVPAWIMKYYILDLTPPSSLVKYLVDRGHPVFCISWKNPDAGDRELGLEDYRRLGVMEALEAVGDIVPLRRVHAVGYCLGGTLLALAAAAMARDGDERLGSLTLLAAQVDFEEAGELLHFIDESQVTFLEDLMWDAGYLDTRQMAGAFQLLRSVDLIWSRNVRRHLLGQEEEPSELAAWSQDATRMPYRMHSEYLHRLFLHDDLSAGRCRVEGRPVALSDIRVPLCAVGTEKDHIAPWRSVYKVRLLSDTEMTFILATGGHNTGIVSPPGPRARGGYQMATAAATDAYVDPEAWAASAPRVQGSWWPAWEGWLRARSSRRVAPLSLGSSRYPPLADAPGEYVRMR